MAKFYKKWCGCYVKTEGNSSSFGTIIHPCGRPGHNGMMLLNVNGMDTTKIKKKDIPKEVVAAIIKKMLLGKMTEAKNE